MLFLSFANWGIIIIKRNTNGLGLHKELALHSNHNWGQDNDLVISIKACIVAKMACVAPAVTSISVSGFGVLP
jgi:hypothetical protein